MSDEVSDEAWAPARPRLAMLRETYDLALDAAGNVWPTPAMALGRLFERGLAFLEAGAELPRLFGSAPDVDLLDELRADLLLAETRYAVTKFAAFVLNERGADLEQEWLQLAEEHLAIRARIVESRRVEEQLKRELARLGAPITALPEHESLPESPPDRPRKSRGMYAHLFDGTETIEAEIEVGPAVLEAADRLAAAQDWTSEWPEAARLTVLAHGLALARRERADDEIDRDDRAAVEAARLAVRRQLMAIDGREATLRRRLFELRHNTRVLGWRITALRIEARGMHSRLELFDRDRARLEAELDAHRSDPHNAHPPAIDESGWRRRLTRLFGTPDC
jgi:hypothetical protein